MIIRKYDLQSNMMIKYIEKEAQEQDETGTDLTKMYKRVDLQTLQPTGELHLHLMIQHKIKDNRVVIHLHPTYIIAAMYAGYDLQELANEFPEINRYTRVGPTVPIIPPISKELADASCLALHLLDGEISYDIIGLRQHGVVVVAHDSWTAYEHCERLEHICQIVLASKR